MKLSILTGTYNREKLLPRLYNSIIENMNEELEVEWLIMDDGSIDNTKEVVRKFIEENKVCIKYFYQENQGKMTAINNLIDKVTGDLIIECDSDDYFRKNAFNIIKNNYSKLDENTYAFCYLKHNQNDCNMGNLFKNEETSMFDLYFKEGESGEKALVFNSKIRKQYKYELENNERFVTEGRMYHKMDLKYKIKCFNEPIMICEYHEDGYSKNILKIFKENPYGYYEYFKEIFTHDMKGISLKKRLYVIKHYILFSYLTKNKNVLSNVKGINKFLVAIFLYPGYLKSYFMFKKM